MHLFYTPDINSDTYTLSEEESKHCVRVLRLTSGDKIQLIDGKGGFFEAEIIDDNPKRCTVSVLKKVTELGKRNWKLHIAIAPTKNMDRLEWFVEKATEIGIEEISLLDCQNSERVTVKTDRLKKVAISAIKQSLKAYLPTINEVADYKKFINSISNFTGDKFIAHCNAPILSYPEGKMPHLNSLYSPEDNALILIGPEGDFSVDEVQLALNQGFKEISLGTSRLRTETAAMYACTVVNVANENL